MNTSKHLARAASPEAEYLTPARESLTHVDALRPREYTPGYRLLMLLHEQTPTTLCSSALIHGGQHSITTLVLDEISMDGVTDEQLYASVDKVLSLHSVHPKYATSGHEIPALVAVWAGMVMIADDSLAVGNVCDVAVEMTESDALSRILTHDLELRPVADVQGWEAVERAGLWSSAFDVLSDQIGRLDPLATRAQEEERMRQIVRKYSEMVTTVAQEVSSGLYAGLPG